MFNTICGRFSKDLINIIVNYVGYHKDLNFEIPFYEKHLDKVNWNGLSGNSNMPITFFEKHLALWKQRGEHNKVDWSNLSSNINIPVTFFEKYLDKVYW